MRYVFIVSVLAGISACSSSQENSYRWEQLDYSNYYSAVPSATTNLAAANPTLGR